MWLVVSHRFRSPCWLWLISDELSAGLPLPLCPTGGTSHRWHYFNYVLRGLSPWQRHRWGFHCCRHHWISFLQKPKAFDSWGHLTMKLSHILKGVMQWRPPGGGVRIMEISPVGCVRGLKCSVGLCQLHSAVRPLPSWGNGSNKTLTVFGPSRFEAKSIVLVHRHGYRPSYCHH